MSGEDSEEAGLRCSRPFIGRIQYFVKYFINSIAVRTIGDALVVEEKGFSGEVATYLQLRLEQEFREGLQHSATGVLDAGCTCPITAASSTGRCNTIYSVDPTILPPRKPICPALLNQT
jgi:hypothetical protein